jgi:plastocyanin
MIVKINPWDQRTGQRVTILAGSDRNQTKKAHEDNRNQAAKGIEDADSGEGGPSKVSINIEDFAFSPATLTIPQGTIVEWTNKEYSVAHTTTGLDDEWDSGTLRESESFSFMFNEIGTYDYLCEIHPLTMKGKIIVE